MATTTGRRAIVIGGSVGGLFAANLRHRRGGDVRVYDRVPGSLESRGTGIAHHPETEAILARAGARDQHAPGVRVEGRVAVGPGAKTFASQHYPQYVTAWAASSTRCASPSWP